MQIIAQYPIAEADLAAHMGRPLGAVLPDGDIVCGYLDRVHEGHVVFRPLENVPEADIARLKRSIRSGVNTTRLSKPSQTAKTERARTTAFGYGGYPYGWSYGNYGWGAGWWWLLPLTLLTALVAFPFWI